MKLSDFDYNLPKELIAKYPLQDRAKSRLMVLDRKSRTIEHKVFEDIEDYIQKGDCLVLNNTKVMPARLFGRRDSGGKVEIFLLEKKNPICEALVRPSVKVKKGEKITLESGDSVEILDGSKVGRRVRFNSCIDDILKNAGHMPLPPYIDRRDEESDRDNYQTVYAAKEGATASPTAGLHFSKKLLDKLQTKGVKITYLTLHTSYGTFAPIKSEDIRDHKMHKEYFEVSRYSADKINGCKNRGKKIIAVGTTACRALESSAVRRDTLLRQSYGGQARYEIRDTKGRTDLFIYPGYEFKTVDCLITNFHLPKSTLLCLVSAFAGREFIFEAYSRAIEEKYRFYSYGDAMLII